MQNHQLIIRPATEKDLALILNFIQQLAEFEKLAHEVVATEESLRNSLFADIPKAEVIIAECNDKPVGFALYFHNYSTFLGKAGIYLEDLFIIPEYRSKGFGKIVFQYLANTAKQRNCGRLEWSVLDWNKKAINFYDSLEANPQSQWITYRMDESKIKKIVNTEA